MKISIIIRLQIAGLHNWPEAQKMIPEVGYLSNLHRHTFHIECEKIVDHSDRSIEFIKFKKEIADYLHLRYFDDTFKCCNFGRYSCEDIATILFNEFNLTSCIVMEDGEFGGKISI